MAPTWADIMAGASLGCALYLSGNYTPATFKVQMQLRDHSMLQTYLVTGAISTFLVRAADATQFMATNVRSPKTVGYFPLDANIFGGLLQGVGMTLSLSCPVTVWVQLATAVQGSIFSFIGCLVGGLAFIMLTPILQARSEQAKRVEKPASTMQHIQTVPQALGLSSNFCSVSFVVASLAASLWLRKAKDPASVMHTEAIIRGAYIGLAQLVTMLICRRTVGVSTAFEDTAAAILRLRQDALQAQKWGLFITSSTKFAVGIVLGALLLAQANHPTPSQAAPEGELIISPVVAIIGGAMMVFGARLAGGCTSGHGMSGIATLSVSSFVTIATMWAASIATAAFIA